MDFGVSPGPLIASARGSERCRWATIRRPEEVSRTCTTTGVPSDTRRAPLATIVRRSRAVALQRPSPAATQRTGSPWRSRRARLIRCGTDMRAVLDEPAPDGRRRAASRPNRRRPHRRGRPPPRRRRRCRRRTRSPARPARHRERSPGCAARRIARGRPQRPAAPRLRPRTVWPGTCRRSPRSRRCCRSRGCPRPGRGAPSRPAPRCPGRCRSSRRARGLPRLSTAPTQSKRPSPEARIPIRRF